MFSTPYGLIPCKACKHMFSVSVPNISPSSSYTSKKLLGSLLAMDYQLFGLCINLSFLVQLNELFLKTALTLNDKSFINQASVALCSEPSSGLSSCWKPNLM